MYGGYSTSSPPLTNNPFIPASTAHASTRFPDLSSPPPGSGSGSGPGQPGYAAWGDGSFGLGVGGVGGGGGYGQQQGVYQQQPQPMQQYPQQTQYQPQMGYAQPQQPQLGYGPTGSGGGGYLSSPTQAYPSPTGASSSGFHPSSSFGQQLAASATISGSSYGYLQGQQGQQQGNNSAYNPAQQQLQNNPGYIPQFDPYAAISSWDATGSGAGAGANASSSQSNNPSTSNLASSLSTGSTTSNFSLSSTSSTPSASSAQPGGYGLSPSGDPHPRDFIRTHKAEVEAWDAYAWKQLLGSFEELMRAWEGRKEELRRRAGELVVQMQAGMQVGYGAYGGAWLGQMQQEGARLQALHKEAESNFDSVAASTFQMKEVFSGYRQSGDLASKRRVREATNAALQGLPGWPQPY